jgi:hypothetical protein
MNITCGDLSIIIEDDKVRCMYQPSVFDFKEWQLALLADRIVYKEKKNEKLFFVADIKEVQFEVDGYGRYNEREAAVAYVLLNGDPEPQFLFSLIAIQKDFALTSQTKAYSYCQQILEFISDKYAIPYIYKISIETKGKTKKIGWVILILVIMTIIWIMLVHSK